MTDTPDIDIVLSRLPVATRFAVMGYIAAEVKSRVQVQVSSSMQRWRKKLQARLRALEILHGEMSYRAAKTIIADHEANQRFQEAATAVNIDPVSNFLASLELAEHERSSIGER